MHRFLIVSFLFFLHNLSAQDTTVEPVSNGLNGVNDNLLYSLTSIEVKPEFPGGIENFYKFIANNFYPPSDKKFKGGRIYVTFVIEKDGSVTDIKVKDLGYGTREEAIRVFKLSPIWTPAEQNGKKVRCQYTIPLVLPSN